MTFSCPSCHREHADPRDAAFVLAVVCADCEDISAYELVVAARIAIVRRPAA